MKIHDAVVIPGDGIGPEVTAATLRILEAAGAKFRWTERQAGIVAHQQEGSVLPASTLDAMAARDAAPPMWKVRMVNCVPGSPIDCAAITPTASPPLIKPPRPRSRP